ncbi:unnamed protein product [Effrenium voratum]|nr:unnamed protein product [Effrenium voratum]
MFRWQYCLGKSLKHSFLAIQHAFQVARALQGDVDVNAVLALPFLEHCGTALVITRRAGLFHDSGVYSEAGACRQVFIRAVAVTSKEDFWRVQIEAIYRRRNPHKLADVSDMLEKHKGKEMVLYRKVCQRYDLNPKKLYADPQAWDSEDKDVKDEDSDGGDKASTAPTGGGLFDSAPAVPSLFLSGSSGSLFGAASSGGDSTSPFSIPVADPDKKINIFGSSTQAEKRFTSALGSTGSGGEGLFAASSGGLFGSGGIFGASSGATEETTPKTKAKPDFPPAPVFGADVEEKTPKSKVKPDFPPAPAFGLEPEKTPTKAKPAFPSGDVPTGLFAGEKTPRSKAKPAFPPAPACVSEEAAVSSLFGSTGTSGNIFGSSAPGEEKQGGANLFGSGNLFAGGTSGDSASGAFFGAGSSGGLFGSAASSGSIFGTGESSFGSKPAETTLGFGGKSSDTKSSETFAFGSNTAETKPSETFGFGSKPAETKPLDLFGAGSKSSDTKSSETFAFGSKTADTKPLDLFGAGKSSDTKSSETFGFGSKPAETKPLDLFGAGSKSSDTKSSETFAFGSNTGDTKPLDLFGAGKLSDTKSSETFGFGSKPAETKPLDLFGAGSKSSDTKSSETFAFGSKTADTKPLDLFGAGKSSDTKSGETSAFGSKTADTKPLDLFGAGKSSDTKSGETFAFGSKPAESKPLDLFGAGGKSSDTKSGETFAFGSKTADTKPPETFGFGSKPAESKPVDLFGAGSKSSSAFGFGSTSGSAGFGSTSGANLFGGKEATGDGLFALGEAKAPASEKRSRSPPLGGDTFGRQVSAPLDLVPGAEEPRSKRRAGSLPDEQKEEAAAEPGPRSKAHADVLAKRKIVRARRSKKEEAPSATEIQAKPSAEFPPPPPNQPLFTPDPAIASLAPGLPGASSSAGDEPAPSSNPFAGITGKPEPKKPEAKPAAKKAKQEETGEAEGPVKVDTKEDLWRVQIEAIYRKRNPMKLKEVPQLMEKHKGKEVILFKKVCKRYDLDPTKIYTNDDAWAGEDKEFKDDPEEPEAEAAQTGAVSVPSLFGNTGGASLFGSATSSGSLFGSGSGGSIFGNASSATSLFGSSSSAASSGGGSALFGAPTAPASGSLFGSGSGSGSGGSIFGPSSGSIFGASSSSGNLFGSTASQSPEGGNIFAGGGGNLFGSGGNLFGSPSSGGFGAGFGAAAPSSGASGSIFCGGSSGSSPFGGGESASLFGSGSSSGNMFAFGATGGSGGTNKKKRRAD